MLEHRPVEFVYSNICLGAYQPCKQSESAVVFLVDEKADVEKPSPLLNDHWVFYVRLNRAGEVSAKANQFENFLSQLKKLCNIERKNITVVSVADAFEISMQWLGWCGASLKAFVLLYPEMGFLSSLSSKSQKIHCPFLMIVNHSVNHEMGGKALQFYDSVHGVAKELVGIPKSLYSQQLVSLNIDKFINSVDPEFKVEAEKSLAPLSTYRDLFVAKLFKRLSHAMQLVHDKGMASGNVKDYIYQNTPQSRPVLGRLIDNLFLQSKSSTSLRQQIEAIRYAVDFAADELFDRNDSIRLVDLQSGRGRAVLEYCAENSEIFESIKFYEDHIENREGAEAIAWQLDIKNLTLVEGQNMELEKKIDENTNVLIFSGVAENSPFIEEFNRNVQTAYKALQPGGFLIFTPPLGDRTDQNYFLESCFLKAGFNLQRHYVGMGGQFIVYIFKKPLFEKHDVSQEIPKNYEILDSI